MGLLNFMPGEWDMQGQGGLLGNKVNPMLQLGLGILANNSGNGGSLGGALGRGGLTAIQNIQEQQRDQMRNKMYEFEMKRAEDEIKRQQAREQALPRLLQGESAYMSSQQVPVTSFQNVPMAPQEGAVAPNFGLQRQETTTMQEQPVFDESAYLKDISAAGFGDEILKRKLFPASPEIMIAPDGTVINKNDPSLIGKNFAAPEKVSTPSAIQEYEYAVGQGYRGSFQQFQTDLKRAGASSTTVSYGAPVAGVDASGRPVFFQPSKDGSAPAIVPGVAPKPDAPRNPTEIQAKAGTFHSQMTAASNELGALSREGFDPSSIGTQVETTIAGGATNPFASGKAQRARQAQEQWAESFLRVKTGAAATKDEVTRNVRTFFPQIGDTPAVIAQKARMRKQAEDDVAAMAGPSAQPQTQGAPVDLRAAAQEELARRKGKR
jgi:hypothetical protein